MANVLGLALKVNADATGLRLDPVERALQRLGQEAEKVGNVFTKFAATSGAAAEEQARTATRFEQLANSLRAQEITAEQYAEAFAKIKAEAAATAAVFDRGAQTAAKFATEQENTAKALGDLAEELRLGAIEAPVFERALQSLTGVDFAGTEEGRRALAELAQQARDGTLDLNAAASTLSTLSAQQDAYSEAQARAARLVESLTTAEERRQQTAAEYLDLLQQGLISEEQRAALLARLGPITEAARVAEQSLAADRDLARRTLEQIATPQEQYAARQAQLDRLLGQNLLSQEQYNAALAQAQTALDRASGASAAAAAAEAARVASQREGAAITASVQTAEERRAERLANLDRLLADAAISEETYRRAVEQANGVQESAARAEQERQRVLDEGKRITEQFTTVEEKRAAELANLERLLAAGAISQETFTRASAQASGANEAAARAERERADALAAASRIIQANLTPQERYDAQIVELQGHLDAGRLSQEQFNRAVERASADLNKTAASAQNTDRQLQSISRTVTNIARLQIARALVDGFQLLSGTVRSVTGQLDSLVDSARQSLDQIDKLALRTGVSREALQGYGVAAELAGVSTDELGATLQRLAANIGRANPPAELTQGLRQLGLTVEQLRALAPEDQFALIAQRISELPTATQRAGAAFGALGEQGVRLTSLLQQQANAIEEVRQRSERLGIIVRDDQIANVTQLNDTFTLVQRTIEGIIGQVSGNLAPLVTALAEEFLAFVEGFQGIEATGGTALADRITDSLIQGARFVAGVFDRVVAQLEGFSAGLAATAETFDIVSNLLSSVFSAARALFELGQSIVSGITFGIGKVLEALGKIPFFSDLEQYGAALADTAFAELERNADQFVAAVDSAARSAGRAVLGESPEEAGARGKGAAEAYVDEFAAQVEQARSPVFRVESDIEKTREAFDDFFGGVIDQSSRVTELMREFEASVAAAREDGELTGDEIARIEELQKRVNAAIQQELATRNEAVAAANAQADADAKRIDSLLKTTDATQKIIDDLSAVEREIARVQQQIADTTAGDSGAAQSRLDELRALQGQLDEQLQATAQGFAEGFDKAFQATGQNFDNLAEQASEFGQAGFDAAARLQEGIALAQEQARDGILNREAYEAEVRRQQQLFEKEIEQVRQVADERKRVNEFVDQQFLLARFGGDQQRLEAANRVAEIEREIVRVQGEVQTARDAGDQAAVNAGIQRLGLLDQVGAREREIASGRQQIEEQIAAQREQYLQQLSEQQKAAEAQQQKFAEERAKAIEAENQRQAARIRELNTLGAGVIGGADIRTSEGAAQFLQLAANRQDPALIEARLQTRRLTELRNAVVELSRTFAGPVVQIGGGVG